MLVNARHDLKRLEAALALYPKETLAAGVRAKNRSMTTASGEGARRIQSELGLKIGTIKRQLKQTRATRSDPRAILDFSANRFRLFGNVPLKQIATKWGVGVRLGRYPFRLELADGTPVTAEQVRRLFLQRSRGGKVNVWAREGRASQPFQAVVAPSLAHTFRERGLGDDLVDIWRRRFAVVFVQEARFRLSKRI